MLVVFDFDGVIVDSMPLHNRVESEVYRNAGINITPSELSRRFSGVPLSDQFKVLKNETGIDMPNTAMQEMQEAKIALFSQELAAVDGVAQMLEEIKEIPYCIASGSPIKELDHALKIVKLHDRFFPHIYSSEMVERGKPAPDLFLYAAKEMGVSPKECVVLEDGIAGVQAARQAGMSVVGFTGGSHCDDEHGNRLLSSGAERIITHMSKLPAFLQSALS